MGSVKLGCRARLLSETDESSFTNQSARCRVDSAELNRALSEIAGRDDLEVRHGKAIPYIGWYWRCVDFDQPISFGDCGDFVGFMENNKWDYPEFTLTPEQDAEVKAMLRDLAAEPSYPKCRMFWDQVQMYRPTDLGKPPRYPSMLEQLAGLL